MTARRFLMPMWDGGGTVPPELGLARRLVERGHAVHVLADPTIEDQAAGAGCSFSPWRRAPHRSSLDVGEDVLKDWQTTNPLVMLQRLRDRFIAGPAEDFAADTDDAIEAGRPDVVLPDCLLFGAIVAAQAASVPVVPIVPNVWTLPTRGAPAIGPGFPLAKGPLGRGRDAVLLATVNRLFRRGLPVINAVRTKRGLAPLTSLYDQVLDTDRILVLSSATFDFSSAFVPANVTYAGPILDEPQWAEPWTMPWPAANGDPVVLVAFSSTFQDQGPLLQRLVDVLSNLPVRAVVTLGPMLNDVDVTSSGNVAVVRSAPHGPILRDASLVVTHCGHGTVMKSLAAGVPMVCIPMGRDQNDTAARVVHHGAGVRLSPRASEEKIARAVQAVLGEPRFRDAAQRMADQLAKEAQRVDIVGEIETMASATTLRS